MKKTVICTKMLDTLQLDLQMPTHMIYGFVRGLYFARASFFAHSHFPKKTSNINMSNNIQSFSFFAHSHLLFILQVNCITIDVI